MRVVLFGDSLTKGRQGTSYLRLLRDWAASDARLADVELVNAGIGDDTVCTLIRRLGRDVASLAPLAPSAPASGRWHGLCGAGCVEAG